MNIICILASGVGNRFGSSIPKQYHLVNGRPVIEYTITAALKSDLDEVILIANEPYKTELENKYGVTTVEGGKTRNQSLINGLNYIKENYDCKKLMVIDNLKLDNFKTKTGVELLNNLKLDGKVLFVASEEAENLYMATRNLNNVLVLFPDEINVYDILNADYVVFDEASIKMVEEALK